MALEHTLWYTEALNKAVGGSVHKLLSSAGIPHRADLPIPDHVTTGWIVLVACGIIFYLFSKKVDKVPTGFQHFQELTIKFFQSLLNMTVGHKGQKFLNFVLPLGLFIFICNLLGLVPGFMSPTSNINNNLALALCAFIYYHYQGIREKGVLRYLESFMGPRLPGYLFPIRLFMLVIEPISHFARPLSLTVRLFGNIMGHDIVILILFMLVPMFVPVPMMLMGIFTSFMQAFIFVVLTMIYLTGAVSEEH